MILVIGQPRTGTSLAMQMIAAAGADCLGRSPAFEDDRFMVPPFDFGILAERQATKIVWAMKTTIPREAHCVVLTRDREQQIASEWKFLNLLAFERGFVPPMGRNHRRKARKAFDRYANEIRLAVQGCRRGWVGFEDMIDVPESAAAVIANTIGFGNPSEMAKCVRKRSSDNYPGLLEAQLLS